MFYVSSNIYLYVNSFCCVRAVGIFVIFVTNVTNKSKEKVFPITRHESVERE